MAQHWSTKLKIAGLAVLGAYLTIIVLSASGASNPAALILLGGGFVGATMLVGWWLPVLSGLVIGAAATSLAWVAWAWGGGGTGDLDVLGVLFGPPIVGGVLLLGAGLQRRREAHGRLHGSRPADA